jgi:hypothetical protein
MSEESGWTCVCGCGWSGQRKFCGECGKPRPAPKAEVSEEDVMALAIINASRSVIGYGPLLSLDGVAAERVEASRLAARALASCAGRKRRELEAMTRDRDAWSEREMKPFEELQAYMQASLRRRQASEKRRAKKGGR